MLAREQACFDDRSRVHQYAWRLRRGGGEYFFLVPFGHSAI